MDAVAEIRPVVPDHLMAAVLRDAATLQPRTGVAEAVRPGIWAQFLDLIGGWPAAGGLAAAGVAGVWLGATLPAGLETAAATLLGQTQAIDLLGHDILAEFDVSEVAQ